MHEPDFVDECYADKDLSLLKKLTLVIPTYNRNYYLSRCLWYHAHFPFGEIIVADSSPEEKKVVNRETVAKVREMFGANVRYLEYEPETEKYGGDIYRKWGDAVQHVETEYSQIVTDKEFLLPEVVPECIDYLDKNPDFVSIGGKKYSLCAKYKNIYSTNERDYHLIPRKPNRTSELSDTILDRYSNAFLKTTGWDKNILLTIYRSKQHKYIYNLLDQYAISDLRYSELVCAYAGYLFGKFKYINDNIYKVRDIIIFNNEGGQIVGKKSSESSNTRYPYLSDYAQIPDGVIFYERLMICCTSQLIQFTSLSELKVEYLLRKYVTPAFLVNYDSGRPSFVRSVLNKFPNLSLLWKNMPMSLKKIGGYLIQKLFGISVAVGENIDCSYNQSINIVCQIILNSLSLSKSDSTIITREILFATDNWRHKVLHE